MVNQLFPLGASSLHLAHSKHWLRRALIQRRYWIGTVLGTGVSCARKTARRTSSV